MGKYDWGGLKISLMYLILILYAVFASVFSISKSLVSHSEQIIFIAGIRMSLAGIILLIMGRIFHKQTPLKFNRHLILRVSLLGICLFLIANCFTTWGLKYISAIKSCLIHNLSPFITFIISYLLIREKITLMKILGLIIGFLGMIPIFYQKIESNISSNGFSPLSSLPELATLIGVSFFCFGWVLMKQTLEKNKECSTFAINGIAMISAGILGLITSYFVYEKIEISNMSGFAYDLILIILIMNIIYSNLYSYLLKRYSATFLSLSSFLAPLFSALFAWIFGGEIVGISFFISLTILIFSLFIFYQGDLKQKKHSKNNKELINT